MEFLRSFLRRFFARKPEVVFREMSAVFPGYKNKKLDQGRLPSKCKLSKLTLSLPTVAKGKLRPNFQISFSKIVSCESTGRELSGFRPQTQKLESPYKTLSNTLAMKGLTSCCNNPLKSIGSSLNDN